MVDAIVIGAGCAGASVSFFLKYFDTMSRVLLIEKLEGDAFTSYHEKCGEGVSGKVFNEIKEVFDKMSVSNFTTINLKKSVEIFNQKEKYMKANGYIIDRPSLLAYMKERFVEMGGTVIQGEFLDFKMDGSGVHVKLVDGKEFQGDMLLGCDGANSRVRRRSGIESPRLKTVMQYVIQDTTHEKGIAKIWYDEKFKGSYKYKFPTRDGLVKLGFELGTDVYDGKYEKKQARQIAYGGLESQNSDRVYLLGDAGGECNPITCGGIRVAFVQGKMLARHLANGKPLSSFHAKWKKTKYSSSRYLQAHEWFASKNNHGIHKFMNPSLKNIISSKKLISIYKKFIDADKHGW